MGLKYSDAWHLAHFWDPRMLSPDSIMPRFRGMFDGPYQAKIVDGTDGRQDRGKDFGYARSCSTSILRERLLLTPNADGLVFVPERGKYPVIFTPNEEYKGEAVTLVSDTEDLKALVAYLQKLGINRGKWRDRFEPQLTEASAGGSMPRSEEWITYGKAGVRAPLSGLPRREGRRQRSSGGLHAEGPAAQLHARGVQVPPHAFGIAPRGRRSAAHHHPWRARHGDADLARVAGKGSLTVIQYIKYELAVDRSDPKKPYLFFVEERPKPPIYVGEAPAPSAEILAHGAKVWKQAKCWECHGEGGKGDGEKAPGLKDDLGFPIPPANLTTGQFKSGPRVQDIFRTMSTGLSGTPMPSFSDTQSEEDRWALSYYVLSLSAFTDPLTGEKMQISEADRAALNDPAVKATESRHAYKSKSRTQEKPTYYAGEAWAKKHGFDFAQLRAEDIEPRPR